MTSFHPFSAEGNAQPEEIDMLWELSKQVTNNLNPNFNLKQFCKQNLNLEIEFDVRFTNVSLNYFNNYEISTNLMGQEESVGS